MEGVQVGIVEMEFAEAVKIVKTVLKIVENAVIIVEMVFATCMKTASFVLKIVVNVHL